MKARLKSEPNKKQKAIIEDECRKEFKKLLNGYNRHAVIQMIHILHFEFGFGEKRLKQFCEKLNSMQKGLVKRYEVGEEEVPDVCEIQLREKGVDIEYFLKEEDKVG